MLQCAITDRRYSMADAHRWAEDGVDFVQLRDKALDAGELANLARQILKDLSSASAKQPTLLINSRADVALAVGAAGVHLTAHPEELTPEQVRRIFAIAERPSPILSVSCHSLDEVHRAREASVDLILFGPVFEKRIDGDQIAKGVGLEALQEACAAAGEIPVFALGGVTRKLLEDCLRAGARGVAGIRLFGGCLHESRQQ